MASSLELVLPWMSPAEEPSLLDERTPGGQASPEPEDQTEPAEPLIAQRRPAQREREHDPARDLVEERLAPRPRRPGMSRS